MTTTGQQLQAAIRQSPPIDLTSGYDTTWLNGRVILITGGASGFGAGFARHWARNGATVIVGDIDVQKGDALAREMQKETGRKSVHFVHCDVTDWQSQVNLFKEAVKLSPHGGLDTVVANAGIAGKDIVQSPGDMSVAEPPKPNFKIQEINFTGVMYTTHLAYYWLPRNPGSKACSVDSVPGEQSRDRHLLLIGSIAGIAAIAVQPQYGAAKHAVTGLFRSLRMSSHMDGVRVNMLCPYFIDTNIVTPGARALLAGGALGRTEDVIDAGTRFVADSRILGRSLVVGPKIHVKQDGDGQWQYDERGSEGSRLTALWEPFADDWEDTEAFNRSFVRILKTARGWTGWAVDMARAAGNALGLVR
jgi:NAD(P)-dependent dehydrogenase (short-subunit alcohol dehydrogenase family)